MLEQYLRQAMLLLEEGALPRQVDAALEAFGMAMGPFRMSDLAGNDVGWRIRKRRYVEKPDIAYSRIADRLCEAGRFGQKTGKRWYSYEPGQRKAIPDPGVDALIAGASRGAWHLPGQSTIRSRSSAVAFSRSSTRARLLRRASRFGHRIDVVYLAGYGFPRYRGGPMFHADSLAGTHRVVDAGAFSGGTASRCRVLGAGAVAPPPGRRRQDLQRTLTRALGAEFSKNA
jgi:3-hydroxyacyl-CoA dehydrogenase